MAGAHRVGDVADAGGGGQQICIAEVTCVVWRRVVPLSGGRFGTRRLSDWQLEDPCGTSIFDEAARLLEAAVYASGLWWTGSDW